MRRLSLCLALSLTTPCVTRGQAFLSSINAVVRVPSHGCSATVIYSDYRHSFLLSCGHVFRSPTNVNKRMTFNIPAPWGWPMIGQPFHPQERVVAFDTGLDLSLLEVGVPSPYVCPVASASYQPGRRFASVGYDEMRMPLTARWATPLGSQVRLNDGGMLNDSTITYTVEPPWHGRSGGALIDLDQGVLIGVCSAYMGDPKAARVGNLRGGPGLYVSHLAIMSFLARCSQSR